MRRALAVYVLAMLASVVVATPLLNPTPLLPDPQGSDPELTTAPSILASALECQMGTPESQHSRAPPLLLVPGTGVKGRQSFGSSWIPLSVQLGLAPCWISPAPYMLNDSQVNAEYVVYAIRALYTASGGTKVKVLIWSQGGLATQWALTFFPSIRDKVERLLAFAPDYRGTVEAGLLTTLGLAGESVWQQAADSAFLTALNNAGGLSKIVPTTNVYSAVDEIVQPQFTDSPHDSSYLDYATNVQMQAVCGAMFIVDHAGALTSQFSYVVGRSALLSKTGEAMRSDFGPTDCNATAAERLTPTQKSDAAGLIFVAAGNLLGGPKVKCEPALMAYASRFAKGKKTCSGVIG